MIIDFETAIPFVLEKEGGYVNDPTDSGGETKYGVSKRAFPDLDIKNLTLQDAKDIYKTHYWDKVLGDRLPNSLRLTVFDMAVNAGVKAAIKLLQKVCKVEEDGILGMITISQAQLVGHKAYNDARREYYRDLVKRRPKNLRFIKGWLNRVAFMESVTEKLLAK